MADNGPQPGTPPDSGGSPKGPRPEQLLSPRDRQPRPPRDPELEAELRRERPAPSREFGDRLRERLLVAELAAHRPPNLWLLVAAYVACGIVLLVIAAVGAGGALFGS
jgi:hypothetical protein